MNRPVAGLVVWGVVSSGLAGLVAVTVEPAAAAPARAAAHPHIGQFAMTGAVNALTTDGDVGASGGLVTLDSGQASLTTRLDSTPSSSVLAQPIRPGSLFETVASQIPSGTPIPTSIPDAEATYPGQGSGSLKLVKPLHAGPFAEGGGSATAHATSHSLSGAITGSSSGLAPLFAGGVATSSIVATASKAAGRLDQVAHTTDSSLTVAGVLTLKNVDADASISVKGGRYVETARVAIGSAAVAGQPVSIGSQGITALGHGLPIGQSTASVTKTLNALLGKAGVTVHTIRATTHSGGRSAYADTGGVQATIKTPTLPLAIAGNVVTVTLGSIVLTEQDSNGLPGAPALPPAVHHHHHHTPAAAAQPPPSTGGLGLPSTTQSGTQPPPEIAPTTPVREIRLAGRVLSAQQLLAGFAGWQFLSLMIPTLYALASSRRRRVRPARVAR